LYNRFTFSDNIKRFFSLNKGICIVICSLILLGFFTGFFVCLKMGQALKLSDLQSIILRNYFCKNIGFFGFLFFSLLCSLLLFFTLYILSYVKFLSFLIIGLIVFFTYRFGVDSCTLIVNLGGVKGSLIVIIGCIPCKLLTYFFYYMFAFKMIYFNKQLSRYGNCCIKNNEIKILFSFYLVVSLLILIQIILLFVLGKIFIFI